MASLVTTATPVTWTRKEELVAIRETLHSKEIQTCNRSSIQVQISASPWRRATLRFHLRDDYPKRPCILELDAPHFAPKVSAKLMKACEARVIQCVAANEMQVLTTILYLKNIIETNLLLPCVDEVKKETKQAGILCKSMTMSEKKGLVRLQLENGAYHLTLDIKVSANYPAEEPKIIFRHSTFPKLITSVYHAQTSEIARRLVLGYTEEQAMRASDGLKRPPQQKQVKDSLSKVRVSNEKLSQLKNDVKVLKKMTKLRKESKMNKQTKHHLEQIKDKRSINQGHEAARRARRELRALVKDETNKEGKWAEEEARLNQIEEGVLQLNAKDSEPKRCVGIIIRFVTQQFVARVPQETCQGCQEPLLPVNPADATGMFDSKSKQRPRRVYCGHWWHTTW